MTKLFTTTIRLYQNTLSKLTAPRCRFYPTCSAYAIQAFEQHSVIKGGFLTIKRLSKCHPFHPGGVDEVPHQQGEPNGTH